MVDEWVGLSVEEISKKMTVLHKKWAYDNGAAEWWERCVEPVNKERYR